MRYVGKGFMEEIHKALLYMGESFIKFSGCVFRYDSSKCKIVVCDKNMCRNMIKRDEEW